MQIEQYECEVFVSPQWEISNPLKELRQCVLRTGNVTVHLVIAALFSSNRVCPSDSHPFFEGFCLSFAEVQRISRMHFQFNTETITNVGMPAKSYVRDRRADGYEGDSSSPGKESSDGESPVCDQTGRRQSISDTAVSLKASFAAVDKSDFGISLNDSYPSVDPSTISDMRSITMKEANSGWLVGRRSLDRQFYLALDDHKTTFSKAMEDARRFEALHFANIFV